MDDFYSTLFGAMLGSKNRGEIIGRTEVNNFVIDTCYTLDQGWETAVWKGSNPMIIVGRYPDKASAQEGHDDWCAVCARNPVEAWSVQNDRYEAF